MSENEQEQPKPEQSAPEEPKMVIGVMVGFNTNGARTIAYSSETQDKDKIHLAQIRELLQWALTHVNDNITQGVIRMEIERAARVKIVKPGFRPMSLLKSIVGVNGDNH